MSRSAGISRVVSVVVAIALIGCTTADATSVSEEVLDLGVAPLDLRNASFLGATESLDSAASPSSANMENPIPPTFAHYVKAIGIDESKTWFQTYFHFRAVAVPSMRADATLTQEWSLY